MEKWRVSGCEEQSEPEMVVWFRGNHSYTSWKPPPNSSERERGREREVCGGGGGERAKDRRLKYDG